MKLVLRIASIGFVLGAFGLGYAWNETGHMVIAALAKSKLSKKANAEADRLLKATGSGTMADFIQTSTWADETRTPQNGPWHYEDHYFRADGKPSANGPDAENAVWAIDKFTKVLADKSRPDAERAEALRYLIHFVGDIHQPLHATARETDAHPKGDRGGNDFPIDGMAAFPTLSRPPRNLHSLWDMGCGLFMYDPNSRTPEGQARIQAFATDLTKQFPKKKLKNAGDRNAEHWSLESFAVCRTQVYSTPENAAPSTVYLEAGRKLSQQRAAYAGYRLADLLNRTLK